LGGAGETVRVTGFADPELTVESLGTVGDTGELEHIVHSWAGQAVVFISLARGAIGAAW
jgi:hypothetical protein